MLFETDRLVIRHTEYIDVDDMFAIYSDIEVMRYLGREPKAIGSVEEIQAVIDRRKALRAEYGDSMGAWSVVSKASGKVIGAVLFKPLPGEDGTTPSGEVEIGWHIGRADWGCGYATEAAQACLTYGLKQNPKLNRVLACFYPENTRSERVMIKIGMTFLESTDRFYGVPLSVYEYTRPSAGN